MSNLPKEEFEFSIDEKWTVGQQLKHFILYLQETLSVLSMDKLVIEQNFERTDRQNRTYEVLQSASERKLIEDGKSTSRFIPETITINQREPLILILVFLVEEFRPKVETFS